MNAKYLVVTLIVVALLVFKVLFFTPIFREHLLFDEYHYVTAGKYIFYKLGILPDFKPPYESEITYSNNTIFINVTLHSEPVFIFIPHLRSDWYNLEHPILAKLVFGFLLFTCNSIILTRLVLLMASTIVLLVFTYTLLKRYGVGVLMGFSILLLADWVYVHFMYLAVLDTLMIMFLVLSITLLYMRRYRLSILFLSLACAVKGIALVATISYAVYFVFTRNKRYVVASILVPLVALVLSYAVYLFFVDPMKLLSYIQGLMNISTMRRELWILGLESTWGLFRLYTPLVWIWFPGLIAFIGLHRDEKVDPLEVLPYLLSMLYLLLVVVLAFKRAIYPYYYAPLIILIAYPVKDLYCFIRILPTLRGSVCVK